MQQMRGNSARFRGESFHQIRTNTSFRQFSRSIASNSYEVLCSVIIQSLESVENCCHKQRTPVVRIECVFVFVRVRLQLYPLALPIRFPYSAAQCTTLIL